MIHPSQVCTRLVDAIAKQKGLKPEQIFVGVGSDDVLAMCFMTFFNSEKPILFPDTVSDGQAPDFLKLLPRREPVDMDFHLYLI